MSAIASPPFELRIPEPAQRPLSEPNCTACFVSLLLEENTCLKIIAWALTFFICLVLSLSLVGVPLVIMGAKEYTRQSLEPLFQTEARNADWHDLRSRAITEAIEAIEQQSQERKHNLEAKMAVIQQQHQEALAAPQTPERPSSSTFSTPASSNRSISTAELNAAIKRALETPPRTPSSGLKPVLAQLTSPQNNSLVLS